ncbi:MAG: glycosyltransferase family 1 protein [Bryobacterales bacterium]|nr:glycosyltransferase family 1 protein [Bryobacterales bacterium]
MRVAIEENGAAVAAWIAALRRQTRDEEIREFQSGTMARVLGAAWLDSALDGADVLHASPHTPCAPKKAKLTATVDDLSSWLMPKLNAPAEAKAAQEFVDRILVHAHGLIAVSESVRQDAIRVLGIEPENITTVYPGVDAEFFDAKPTPSGRSYVLATGGDQPRQNFQTVQDAWQALKPELRNVFELVVEGAPQPSLMAGATLLVHVPLYEGFALPVARAMAAGIAVVTSDSSSLPEIGRDAGLMVDPHNPAQIAAAITRLLESESERAKLARRKIPLGTLRGGVAQRFSIA